MVPASQDGGVLLREVHGQEVGFLEPVALFLHNT